MPGLAKIGTQKPNSIDRAMSVHAVGPRHESRGGAAFSRA